MVNEEVAEKTIRLAITTTKLTGRALAKGLHIYLRHRKEVKAKKAAKKAEPKKGKQSVKELIGQNQGVSRMPLGDASIRDFEREARKYGVDFAVTKDKSVHPPQYTVFFKARDNDALQQIADSLMAKQLNAEKKPSIVKQLEKLKALVASLPSKVRHKEQEHSL